MSEHTPGPWRIEGRRGAGYIISAGMNVEGDGPADYVGVLDPMFWIAGEPDRLKPDAKLCIAAPDLLDALRAMLRATEFDDREPWIVQAHAAIKKATGQ